ncbi:MAG: TetR/AcrR family transcriptional regulator [Candidatus Cloacimonetes bacterium]|nr:TetR/AcrR family transcriptional regulator [Candidatus Cloacimonadota bacterium]
MNQPKDRKQVILETATRIFARFGYNKTALDEIAQEANIAKGTIYYYFSSKEELFLQVVKEQFAYYFHEMEEHLAAMQGFEAKFRYFLQGPMKYVCENMPIWIDALKSIPFNVQEHFEEFRSDHREYMLKILHEIIDEGVAEGMISEQLDLQKLSIMINDWFLLGNFSVGIINFDELLLRLERDHEIIAQLILYGILKRG